MASMSLNWRGRPSQRAASSSTSRRRSSSSLPSTGGMSGAVEGQAEAGGGDPLVEGFGELLDGQQAAGHLDGGAAPHVHRGIRPAAHPGGRVAEPIGGDQGRNQGGVGALAVDEAHLATQHAGQVGEAQQGDGLAGAGGADHGHGLAAQLRGWDDVAALAPAAPGRRPGRSRAPGVVSLWSRGRAISRAVLRSRARWSMRWRRRTKGLHSAPPAARSAFHTDSEAASSPTGTASHTWVATRSQRNWLTVMRVPGGPKPKWRATYCQKCWGTKMCRRRASSRAGHGQHDGDGDEAGEGEAPPVPAALEQDHRLPDQPRHDGQGREPDQHQHDQQQAVGGRLTGRAGDRLAGGGLPTAGRSS